MIDAADLRQEIVRISHLFHQNRWSLATSGNYSARLDSDRFLITASGKDKGLIAIDDIVCVGMDGRLQEESKEKPSAETELHGEIYRFNVEIGAILHTHSVFSTVLSSLPQLKAPLTISGYEMLKALRGVTTHLHTEHIPVFANDQDMKRLSRTVLQYLETNPDTRGVLIVGHGLYTWGRTLSEAQRHTEAFEFLLECEYRKLIERRL
jgi:methylthioribulose-1-phosphate dehydratase